MKANVYHAGKIVLVETINSAKKEIGARLHACYALGSLAHGGFSTQVSDIDLAIILTGPLTPEDGYQIETVKNHVRGLQIPLAERLSIFWGTLASLENEEPGGRFPPADKLDLINHGILLTGCEVRKSLSRPTKQELEVFGAIFALNFLERVEINRDILQPSKVFDKGVIHLTKLILFPVRFLYTADTGEIGLNDVAVAHYLKNNQGSKGELVKLAFRWRYELFTYSEHAVNLIRQALMPLYLQFLDTYLSRMLSYKEISLAEKLEQWRIKLLRELC